VYDLSSPSYSLLYCLPAAGVTDVKLGSSYVLLVKEAVITPQQQQQRHKQQQQHQQQQQRQGEAEPAGCPAAAAVLPVELLSAVNGMVSSNIIGF
jgi:hypothetical protein